MYKLNKKIYEDFEDEAKTEFAKADWEAGGIQVDPIYIPDSKTGIDLELWRKDWLCTTTTNNTLHT